MSENLVEFLRARLDEDGARQRDIWERWHHRDCEYLPDRDAPTFECNCGVPERGLAEIEAKRQILSDLKQAEFTLSRAEPGTAPHYLMTGAVNMMRRTVCLLAVP